MRRRRSRPNDPLSTLAPPTYSPRKALIQVYPPKRALIDLRTFEDRRRFHFNRINESLSAGVLDRVEARRIIERMSRMEKLRRDRRYARDPSQRFKDFMPSMRLGFMIPEKVVKCIRRKNRREVIFALNKQGKGSRSFRRRRDEFSDISCKRT